MVISCKRYADGLMHSYRALWPPDTFRAYNDYMNTAFATFQGVGIDARINTSSERKQRENANWSPEWNKRLTGEVNPAHQGKYQELMSLFKRDLGY